MPADLGEAHEGKGLLRTGLKKFMEAGKYVMRKISIKKVVHV